MRSAAAEITRPSDSSPILPLSGAPLSARLLVDRDPGGVSLGETVVHALELTNPASAHGQFVQFGMSVGACFVIEEVLEGAELLLAQYPLTSVNVRADVNPASTARLVLRDRRVGCSGNFALNHGLDIQVHYGCGQRVLVSPTPTGSGAGGPDGGDGDGGGDDGGTPGPDAGLPPDGGNGDGGVDDGGTPGPDAGPAPDAGSGEPGPADGGTGSSVDGGSRGAGSSGCFSQVAPRADTGPVLWLLGLWAVARRRRRSRPPSAPEGMGGVR